MTPSPPAMVPLTSAMKQHFNLTDEEARWWCYLPETGEVQQTLIPSPRARELMDPDYESDENILGPFWEQG